MGHPSPLPHAGQGRDLRAGPQKGAGGGRYPSDSRRVRLGAERQSLPAALCVAAPQQRSVPAAAFAPLPPPQPPCPTSPVPGRCAAARISTNSSRLWVSWCGGRARSARKLPRGTPVPKRVVRGGSGRRGVCGLINHSFLCVPVSQSSAGSGTNRFS